MNLDFNTSKKVNSPNNGVDCRKTDWKLFLIAMCSTCRTPYDPVNPQKTLVSVKVLPPAVTF